MNNNDLLYTNKFIEDPNLHDISIEDQKRFRKFMEEKRKKQNKEMVISELKNGKEVSDLLNTNEYNIRDNNMNMGFLPKHSDKHMRSLLSGEMLQNSKQKRVTVPRSRVLNIDSRDRDLILYPYQNNFKIDLRKAYRNIRSIRLIALEFPNSDFGFKNTPESVKNVVFYWQNESDKLFSINNVGMTNSSYMYSAEINPGNYTATSLASEIQTRLNAVKRDFIDDDFEDINEDANLHSFTVSINDDTDILELTSLLFVVITDTNPISTTSGSGTITVIQSGHNFTDGETVIITGAKTTGGISSSVINGSHTATGVVGGTSFKVDVASSATSTVEGGGTTVSTGKPDSFKLFFGRFTDTPGQELGFALEDTSEDIISPDTNQFSISVLSVDGVTIGDPTTITSINHGLSVTDYIMFSGLVTAPTVLKNQVFQVLSVSTDGDSFTIDFETTNVDITTFKDATIRTNKITVSHIGSTRDAGSHGMNEYVPLSVSISSIVDDIDFKALITTAIEHNLETNDNVLLSGTTATDSGGSLDGVEKITKVSDTSFTIDISSINLSVTQGVGGITGITITSIVDDADGLALVTTNQEHKLQSGNLIHISNTLATYDTTPSTLETSVNGYYVITVLTSTTFNIKLPETKDINTVGAEGDINLDRSIVRFYRCEELGGIKPRFINNIDRIITRISTNSYSFLLDPENDTSFAITNVNGGGGDIIRISSHYHGFSGVQNNTSNGTLINRLISLEGENYCYITSQAIGSTMEDSSGVSNIFAKVLLNFSPGTVAFNSFITNPRIYDQEGPLKELSSIDLHVKIHNNINYEFNDIDYSLALEIVELVDIVPNSQFSAVRGVGDIDLVGTGIGSIGASSGEGNQIQQPIENKDWNTGQINDKVEFRESTFPSSGS